MEPLRPTLVIGLGGTGREVLLRLRRRSMETHGVPTPPGTEHLWIDTELDHPDVVHGHPAGFISHAARLRAEEIIDARVGPEDVLSYFQHPERNPHIFSWIFPHVRKHGPVLHGSGARRQLGRLAFFHHAAGIRRRLIHLANELAGIERRDRMRNEPGSEIHGHELNVVLVCSAAGGTGGGMLLDLAFMVRHLSQAGEIWPAATVGYLVLPPVFAPATSENERLYANGYALLRELEHYGASVPDESAGSGAPGEPELRRFRVDWLNTGEVSVAGPPFDTCYLIGNGPIGAPLLPPDRRGDLFDVIAEALFLEGARDLFAIRKRSARSNLREYLANELEYDYTDGASVLVRDVRSCRFSAFGLSKLSVPVERMREACACRLARDLVNAWLASPSPSPDAWTALREQAVGAFRLHLGNGRDDLRERLEGMDDAGVTLQELVWTHWRVAQRQELRARVRLARPGMNVALAEEFAAFRRAYFDLSGEGAGSGAIVGRLRGVNGPRLVSELRGELESRLHQWLNDPRLRLRHAVALLQELESMLADLERCCTRQAEQHSDAAARHLREWQRLVETIGEEEADGPWVHRWSLQALAGEACDGAARYFESLGYAELYRVGAKACAALRSAVVPERVMAGVPAAGAGHPRNGWIGELHDLQEMLDAVRAELAGRLDALERGHEHQVFTDLYTSADFGRFYQLAVAGGGTMTITERALLEAESGLLGEMQIPSPLGLLQRAREAGPLSVAVRLREICARRFREPDATAADAVAVVFEREWSSAGSVAPMASRLAERGSPWLRPDVRARAAGSPLRDNYRVVALLGMAHAPASARHAEFADAATASLSRMAWLKDAAMGMADTESHSVLLYSEMAGLPLAWVENIEGYRRAYRGLSAVEGLHLDRHSEHLPEVVVRSGEEVLHALRAHRAVLLAAIINVFEAAPAEMLAWTDRRAFPPQWRTLGGYADAVERLQAEPGLLDTVEFEIDDRVRSLTPGRLEQVYTVVASLLLDGRSFGVGETGPLAPRAVRVNGEETVRFPAGYGAAVQLLKMLERRVAEASQGEPAESAAAAAFHRWYSRRLEFALPVRFGTLPLLVLREGAHAEVPHPPRETHEQSTGYQSAFVSYGGGDEEFARRLTAALKQHGVDVFFFPSDALPGDRIHHAVEEAMDACDRVLVLCSRSSLGRKGVLHEIEEARGREAAEGGASIIIPVGLDDTLWSGTIEPARIARALRRRQIADFRGAAHDPAVFAASLERLLRVLRRPPRREAAGS
ncbi:MAG TPA: tubulin-like doman-containing protein [Longimicrobium sp.]|nr:tubulin-like doman-containing protein [Longimicrobium sp.]